MAKIAIVGYKGSDFTALVSAIESMGHEVVKVPDEVKPPIIGEPNKLEVIMPHREISYLPKPTSKYHK